MYFGPNSLTFCLYRHIVIFMWLLWLAIWVCWLHSIFQQGYSKLAIWVMFAPLLEIVCWVGFFFKYGCEKSLLFRILPGVVHSLPPSVLMPRRAQGVRSWLGSSEQPLHAGQSYLYPVLCSALQILGGWLGSSWEKKIVSFANIVDIPIIQVYFIALLLNWCIP